MYLINTYINISRRVKVCIRYLISFIFFPIVVKFRRKLVLIRKINTRKYFHIRYFRTSRTMLRYNLFRVGGPLTRARSSAAVENLLDNGSNTIVEEEFANAKPYSEVPGPKPIPILGNTWRLLPVIGGYLPVYIFLFIFGTWFE